MNLPPLDHVGWGRLLAAVMETGTQPERTTTPAETSSTNIDLVRLQRMERRERTTVEPGSRDVYA